MSWIQENKFVAGLAGVTAVVGGAILFFGNSQGSAYDAKMLEFEDLKSKHTKLVKAKPYPDAANLKARQNLIKSYEQVIGDVRTALAGYQPGKLEKLTPQQFSDIQVKMQSELRAAFEQAGTTIPQECAFGFEKYVDKQPKASATARLNFELGAMKWMLTKLADVKPQALISLKREELASEKGAVPAAQPVRRNNGRGQKGSTVEKPYVLMPVELAFTATEASLRDFLKEMANSKEYFYAIRAIRIRNEKQTAPTVKDADFPSGGGNGGVTPTTDDPFGGIELPDVGDDEEGDGDGEPQPEIAPKPVANGERILKQVLGSEKLNVYISFDILLIKGDKPTAAAPSGS